MKSLEFLLPIAALCVCLLALSVWLARVLRRPAFVEIQPRYRRLLRQLGLIHADAFLQLNGTIISGHPDRNVQRLTLEAGGESVSIFLNREHYVGPWVRIVNAL